MRVCLIGATHPCHNPRLVREADTLAERGHEVRVIGVRTVPALMADDERLMSTRKWPLEMATSCDRTGCVPHGRACVTLSLNPPSGAQGLRRRPKTRCAEPLPNCCGLLRQSSHIRRRCFRPLLVPRAK